MKRRLFLATAFWPALARAHSYRVGEVAIGHPWALPATQGVDGQAFMPVLNESDKPDALLSARSEICSLIELRRNARYDDPAEARFELAPKMPLAMRPGGRHLRLIGLRKPLAIDDRFTLILDFLAAGEAEVEIHVETTPGT